MKLGPDQTTEALAFYAWQAMVAQEMAAKSDMAAQSLAKQLQETRAKLNEAEKRLVEAAIAEQTADPGAAAPVEAEEVQFAHNHQ